MKKPDSLQGTLDLLVLKILSRRPRTHGYGIMAAVKDCSDDLLRVEEGSLYPALYRMEEAGWICAEWIKKDTGRRVRVYELTAAGDTHLGNEAARWQPASAASNQVLRTVLHMSLWSRVVNAVCGEQLRREITEEMESHIVEAVEHGRDPDEARRAFGRDYQQRQQREASYEIRTIRWLDLLRADLSFGWKQLKRNKVASIVAIFSLALAMGASIGAFCLMDALLWRPLPVAHSERLYAISREVFDLQGKPIRSDAWAYPSFSLMRDAVKDQAELIAISPADRKDLTYGSDQDMEKANVQYVSGSMFQAFGLKPALGRLLAETDDQTPGSHPYAVLSYDYWTQRFGKDPRIIGRTFRFGKDLYEITGVVDGPFTGTEPGTMTDIFL